MWKKIEKKSLFLEMIPSELSVLNCLLLRRENLWPAVNVLKKSPKILPIPKRYFFELNCHNSD